MTDVKIYIAGPMTGLPDNNYPAFHEAARELQARGFEPLNPAVSGEEYLKENPHHILPYEWYMREGLKMLLQADGVALLPGWRHSNGARFEVKTAQICNIDVLPVDQWHAVSTG